MFRNGHCLLQRASPTKGTLLFTEKEGGGGEKKGKKSTALPRRGEVPLLWGRESLVEGKKVTAFYRKEELG